MPRVTRRAFCHAAAALPLAASLGPSTALAAPPRLSPLALFLAGDPRCIGRDAGLRATSVFGLPLGEARMIYQPVSRYRALPAGYVPPDLVGGFGRPLRAMLSGDLAEMVTDARREGIELLVVSAFRSRDEQAMAYQASMERAVARGAATPIDAAERASRYVAPPGHSQHQLGTAIDFSSSEMGYSIGTRFEDTVAHQWLKDHGAGYGFVLPYPRDGEPRSGYAFEPWHWRWIGRDLAEVLHEHRYLDDATVVADDYLRALEELLDAEGIV